MSDTPGQMTIDYEDTRWVFLSVDPDRQGQPFPLLSLPEIEDD